MMKWQKGGAGSSIEQKGHDRGDNGDKGDKERAATSLRAKQKCPDVPRPCPPHRAALLAATPKYQIKLNQIKSNHIKPKMGSIHSSSAKLPAPERKKGNGPRRPPIRAWFVGRSWPVRRLASPVVALSAGAGATATATAAATLPPGRDCPLGEVMSSFC